MGFEANRQKIFSKRIIDLPDQPNMAANDLKAYFDSSAEELRESFNVLCDALGDFSAAAKMGYRESAGVPAKTVQDAIENVQQQLRDVTMGTLPSGCVTNDKLAQDVRDRFTAVENTVKTEAKARSEADARLQENLHTAEKALALKSEVLFTTYTGDGQESRVIDVGFRPKAVMVFRDSAYTSFGNSLYGGFIIDGTPMMYGSTVALEIVDNGFKVLNLNNCLLNLSSYTYVIAAFK